MLGGDVFAPRMGLSSGSAGVCWRTYNAAENGRRDSVTGEPVEAAQPLKEIDVQKFAHHNNTTILRITHGDAVTDLGRGGVLELEDDVECSVEELPVGTPRPAPVLTADPGGDA